MTHRRDVPLLWVSQAASQLGTSISALAYPLLVLETTGSALQAGTVATAVALAGLLLRVPGGALADRVRPRLLLPAADLTRATLLALLAVLVATGGATLPLIWLVVTAEVAAGCAFGPSEFSLLRAIVPRDQRALVLGRMQSRSQLAALVGPLVGGALFAVAPAAPFAADAGSYLASAVLVLAVRARVVPPGADRAERQGMRAVLRWLRQDGFLLPWAVWTAVLTAAFAAVGLVVIVVARDRGATAAEIGAMYSISGAGGLVGALLTPAIQRRWRPVTVFRAAALLDAVAAAALVPLHDAVLIGIAGALAFLLAPAVSASLFGELSLRCPDRLVGRAQSTLGVVTGSVAPLAAVAVGGVTDAAGVLGGILACTAVFATLAVVALVLPGEARVPPVRREGRASAGSAG